MIKRVSFMWQCSCGCRLPGLLQHLAVDGRPDLDPTGAAGDHSGQHEHLRIHARLLGKVTSPEPDVVPAHRLHCINLDEIPGVRCLLEKFPSMIRGIPGDFATSVQGIPGIEQSKVHHRPSCVAERYDPAVCSRLALVAPCVNPSNHWSFSQNIHTTA